MCSFHSFHLRFTVVLFHTFCFAYCVCIAYHGRVPAAGSMTPSSSVCFLSWDWGACYALWASRCDLRDVGWGDPEFPQRDEDFLHPSRAPCICDFSVFGVASIHARLNRQHISCCNSHRADLSAAMMWFFCFLFGALFCFCLVWAFCGFCLVVLLCFVWSPSHRDNLDCV